MPRLVLLFTTIVALLLALGGCADSTQPESAPQLEMPPVEDLTSQIPTGSTGSSMGGQVFSHLDGFWVAAATAAEGSAIGAVDPSGTWEFVVLGESMTAHVGERRYEGLLSEADGGWTYFGMITGVNEIGEQRGGYIELDATDTGEGSFTGTLVQSVDADGSTPSYTGRWSIEATRQ